MGDADDHGGLLARWVAGLQHGHDGRHTLRIQLILEAFDSARGLWRPHAEERVPDIPQLRIRVRDVHIVEVLAVPEHREAFNDAITEVTRATWEGESGSLIHFDLIRDASDPERFCT